MYKSIILKKIFMYENENKIIIIENYFMQAQSYHQG